MHHRLLGFFHELAQMLDDNMLSKTCRSKRVGIFVHAIVLSGFGFATAGFAIAGFRQASFVLVAEGLTEP